MFGAKSNIDMGKVKKEIEAGRTPTCPDCGEGLTKVFSKGALVPAGFKNPRPEDHKCDPDKIARLKQASASIGAPGETRADKQNVEPVEVAQVFVDAPPTGDAEDI